ncbi:Protein of unknown function [Gryllus bimaculatus]|nr:Protein of unknown function [Gryllus bimaculatus]
MACAPGWLVAPLPLPLLLLLLLAAWPAPVPAQPDQEPLEDEFRAVCHMCHNDSRVIANTRTCNVASVLGFGKNCTCVGLLKLLNRSSKGNVCIGSEREVKNPLLNDLFQHVFGLIIGFLFVAVRDLTSAHSATWPFATEKCISHSLFSSPHLVPPRLARSHPARIEKAKDKGKAFCDVWVKSYI